MTNYRDRKKERTRANLTDAAIALFLERGFEETTVEEIATAVGVGRRTFFHYFPTKNDVLFSWYDGLGERLSFALGARPTGEGALRASIAALQDFVEVYNDRFRIVSIVARLGEASASIRARQMHSRFTLQNEIAMALALRLPASAGLAPNFIAAIAMTASYAAVDQWLADPARPLVTYSKTAFAQALHLFSTVDEQFVLK